MATAKSKTFGTQKAKVPHLGAAKGASGLTGEIGDLRADVEAAFLAFEKSGGLFHTDLFAAPAAPTVAAHKTAFATSASAQSFSRASTQLDGSLAATELVPPRNVVVTSTSHAHVTAVIVAITGRVRDITGALVAQTDTITLTAGGGASDAGTKPFAFVDKVDIPAQGGASGSLQIGTGALLGTSAKVRLGAGGASLVLMQLTDGTPVTNGVFAAAAPVSTFAPNSAANGTRNYTIIYAVDPA